jgi:hypothetical protein
VTAEQGRQGVWLLEEIWARAGVRVGPQLLRAVN